MPDLLTQLATIHSWRLERISPTTFPRDITFKLSGLSPLQLRRLADMIRAGVCYRCRIGKGRYHFGKTAAIAVTAALAAYRKRKS